MRLVLCSALLLLSSPSLAGMIVGRASVIDGGTLEIRGRRVSLLGIEAPDAHQTCMDTRGGEYACGQRAAQALEYRISGNVVHCEPQRLDGYSGVVAVCRSWGEDLSAWMVGLGWALACRNYSTRYVPAEDLARRRDAGMWSEGYKPPLGWRRSEPTGRCRGAAE
jgi:endonuclease YncB( thermonuclease family)